MKKKNVHHRMDREIVHCLGTDIPPLSSRQFFVFGIIEELIEKKGSNILSENEIFKGLILTKSEKFLAISSLIKNKIISRVRISNIHHSYTLLPKINYRKSTEMRIYQPRDNKERMKLMKELMHN